MSERTEKKPIAPLPGGRWTVVQFGEGLPPELIRRLVAEHLEAHKAERKPKEAWVALLGEFFMGEGRPVLLLSPKVPASMLSTLRDCLEPMGPLRVRKESRTSLAFRGAVVARLQDDLERAWLD